MKQILPQSTSWLCQFILQLNGIALVNIAVSRLFGMPAAEVARFYHKVYATIAGYRYLNETVGNLTRGTIPQTFTIETDSTPFPLLPAQFNHRMLSPGEAYDCYSSFWDNLTAQFPFLPPWLGDPRFQPLLCAV